MDIIDLLDKVPMKEGRYVISSDMSPELKDVCEKTNALKDEREKKIQERIRVKRSMGL